MIEDDDLPVDLDAAPPRFAAQWCMSCMCMSYNAGRGWELEDGEELQERRGGERGAKTWRTERRCMLTMGGTIRKLERRRKKRRRTTIFHILRASHASGKRTRGCVQMQREAENLGSRL